MSDQEIGLEAHHVFDKAQTVDPEVRAHVYSLVTALGGTGADDAGSYVLGDDALACLRDLKRWLKLYDEKNNRLDVARCLAEANLVNGDLLPILAAWTEDSHNNRAKARLALACLELLVPLTWPLEHAGGMTVNHHRHTPYIQQAHVRYKAGALCYDRASILRTIVRIGLPSIATSKDDRTSRDEGIIKLMLYFFRNISIITPLPNLPSQGLDDEISRSATIEAFRQQDVFALLLTMCSNMGEDFNLQDVIVLEIIFNLIKGVNVEKLFMNEEQRKIQKTTELKDVLGKEKGMHREYAKIAPTRHGRFGTMIWVKREDEKVSAISGQDNLKDGRNSLLKMDKSKKWSKPQQRRKDLDHSIYDFDHSVRLTADASELLRNFVEEFLDSGFNPLFTHLRKAIEREADRLLDINYRQFFYTVSWFLQAERCRRARQEKDRKNQKVQTDFEAESYGLVAAVLNQETFITLNRYMQTSFDNKEWQDLNASMRCFTQILLTVQEMAQSSLEEDQEIADNIQNRIFYEETTHDRIVGILKGYKDQGFGYLDACTELSHVFLRMLERYSKENADLQIRSRRRARRKKKEQQITQGGEHGDDDDDARSENEDIAEAAQVSRERKFDFTRFAAKFTSQSSVNTLVAFTAFYRDLSIDQLKRAHRFFYRVAFKQELAVLLFRVDILALFYQLIKGPEGLDRSNAMYQEWDELVRQVLKKMFKKLEQRPELIVEMLFSKIRATLYYLEYGHERQTVSSTRTPAELEVKPAPDRDVNEQIGIVVAALLKDDKESVVRWVLETIAKAADERKAWDAEATTRRELSGIATEPHEETTTAAEEEDKPGPKAPSIMIRPPTDEIRTAIFKDAKLKLLMTLCGFERSGAEEKADATWIMPSAVSSTNLEELHTTIEKYLDTMWTDPSGEDPENFLRRVRTTAAAAAYAEDDEQEPRRDAFIDDSEGSDDLQDFMFPDNVRSKSDALTQLKKKHKKRKLTRKNNVEPLAEDELDERRKAREQAALDRRRKIKSELYIRDSDEEMDEEENRAFFAREEENRRKQAQRVMAALSLGRTEESAAKKKEKKRKSESIEEGNEKRRRWNDSEDERMSGIEDEIEMMEAESASSPRHRAATSDDELDIEDTPLSSQSQASNAESGKDVSLREIPQPRLNSSAMAKGQEADDSDDELPVLASQRRRVRAGFILDDSDED
ncbi:hypothetical protein GJ744_006354 [Endocarpon pusillum]|uniref:Topoisomerase 1-associated factor 1 n=1 Tax=Endocarpon pusillum TaxID=364733 RepID=A0A8H7E6Y6_9EURO|nr:hypothetical protein GJ744_006354 [Endocarpon pusillum]